MKDLEKKDEIEAMIGKIQSDIFTDLISLSGLINDYTVEIMDDNMDKYEEEMRVNVAFDDNEFREDDDEDDDDHQNGNIKENDSDDEDDA